MDRPASRDGHQPECIDSPNALAITSLGKRKADLNDPRSWQRTEPGQVGASILGYISRVHGSARPIEEGIELSMEKACVDFNNKGLELFGNYMYTFINSVFGNEEIMKQIRKMYPHPGGTTIEKIQVPDDGEGGVHWFLQDPQGGIRCSVDGCTIPGESCPRRDRGDGEPLQHYGEGGRDVNDTLCQSYTILGYLSSNSTQPSTKRRRPRLPLEKWAADNTDILPSTIAVSGGADRYELQQNMVLAYLMLLWPQYGSPQSGVAPPPPPQQGLTTTLRDVLRDQKGIFADPHNLTMQVAEEDTDGYKKGEVIDPQGPYPKGAYVVVQGIDGSADGIVVGYRSTMNGYKYRIQPYLDNGELSKDRRHIEFFPADQVQLSLGHLSLDEFITYILVTLSAWVQWGWLYYKGDGTVSGREFNLRHLRREHILLADDLDTVSVGPENIAELEDLHSQISSVIGPTHPAAMRALSSMAKIRSKLSTSRGTKRSRSAKSTRSVRPRTTRSRASVRRGGKVSSRKKRSRAKRRSGRHRIKSS